VPALDTCLAGTNQTWNLYSVAAKTVQIKAIE
jgi:hypothetical protein